MMKRRSGRPPSARRRRSLAKYHGQLRLKAEQAKIGSSPRTRPNLFVVTRGRRRYSSVPGRLEERGVRVARGAAGKAPSACRFLNFPSRALRALGVRGARTSRPRPGSGLALDRDLGEVFARDYPGQRVALRTGRVDGVEAET